MLQFYKTKDESGTDIAINANSVAQIESYLGRNDLSLVVMNNGRKYRVNENCFILSEKLEKLANYTGC